MDSNRKLWNDGQQELRRALLLSHDHDGAIDRFLNQHAMVHSAVLAQSGFWSFEDEIWGDMPEEMLRGIPPKQDHSVAWIVWHIARIEDVTMNFLVAGSPQIFRQDTWLKKLKITAIDTGNLMAGEDIAILSATIDLEALRAYRLAVGRRTREIVQQLQPEGLKQKVDPARLRQVLLEGAVVEAAGDLIKYWGGLTIAGLLLMPPTRHNFVHLNEALRIKQKYH
jgi:hypothetical protein